MRYDFITRARWKVNRIELWVIFRGSLVPKRRGKEKKKTFKTQSTRPARIPRVLERGLEPCMGVWKTKTGHPDIPLERTLVSSCNPPVSPGPVEIRFGRDVPTHVLSGSRAGGLRLRAVNECVRTVVTAVGPTQHCARSRPGPPAFERIGSATAAAAAVVIVVRREEMVGGRTVARFSRFRFERISQRAVSVPLKSGTFKTNCNEVPVVSPKTGRFE